MGRCRESKESNTSARNVQKLEKMGGFAHILAYKLTKMLFFAKKYSTRYTPDNFFEEYINLKNVCYLRHCGIIPVQIFRSHIRTQPPGLELI
jgi:hypothetical protein